jgi:hypothetical protein
MLEGNREYLFALAFAGARGRSGLVIKEHGTGEILVSEEIPWRLPRGFRGRIGFENCDNRESVWINSERIWSRVYSWGEPKEEPSRSGWALVFKGFRGTLDNLVLERDMYYTNAYDPDMMGGYAVRPEHPFQLGPDEYFALGDNSSNSRDSRYFGPVGRNDIMGNAVMVFPWIGNSRFEIVK